MILYRKNPKNSKISFKSQTKNSQANDLQKKTDFYNLALKSQYGNPYFHTAVNLMVLINKVFR